MAKVSDILEPGLASNILAYADNIWDKDRQCFVSEYNFDNQIVSSDDTLHIQKVNGVNDIAAEVTLKVTECDDYARYVGGHDVRIPTAGEWQELFDNTDKTFTIVPFQGGFMYVVTFTGTNGNSIDIPFNHLGGNKGIYWTSDLGTADLYAKAATFVIGDNEVNATIENYQRHLGGSVRSVSYSGEHSLGKTYVDLALPSGIKWADSNECPNSQYVCWGGITPSSSVFTLEDYPFYNENTYIKYSTSGDNITSLENGDPLKGHLEIDYKFNITTFVDVNGHRFPCTAANVKSITIDGGTPMLPTDGNINLSSQSILSNLQAGYGILITNNTISVKLITEEEIDEICV